MKEVWCKATGDFSVDLLHEDLREIVLEIYNTEEDIARGKVSDWLYGPIERIFDLFKNLAPAQRQQLPLGMTTTMTSKPFVPVIRSPPAHTTDIRCHQSRLEKALKDFSKSLFTDVMDSKQ